MPLLMSKGLIEDYFERATLSIGCAARMLIARNKLHYIKWNFPYERVLIEYAMKLIDSQHE